MSAEEPTKWKIYEEVANYLVETLAAALGLGLERVEGKQKLIGESGTTWEVDRKGVTTNGRAIVVIECRRYTTSKLKQKDMAALAYTIRDVGAAGGIVVTPKGVQEGARKIAEYEGIRIVGLDQDATRTDFMLESLEKVIAGRSAKLGGTGTLAAAAEAVQPDEPWAAVDGLTDALGL